MRDVALIVASVALLIGAPDYQTIAHGAAGARPHRRLHGMGGGPVTDQNTSPTGEYDATPVMLTVPSEEALYDLLSAINVSGHGPELACTIMGNAAAEGQRPNPWACAFVASLTDPDAAHVHYLRTDDDGGSGHCCECMEHLPKDCWLANWEPSSWPVFAVLGVPINEERIDQEDYLDPWWRDQVYPSCTCADNPAPFGPCPVHNPVSSPGSVRGGDQS